MSKPVPIINWENPVVRDLMFENGLKAVVAEVKRIQRLGRHTARKEVTGLLKKLKNHVRLVVTVNRYEKQLGV
jgi:hypothetical protein